MKTTLTAAYAKPKLEDDIECDLLGRASDARREPSMIARIGDRKEEDQVAVLNGLSRCELSYSLVQRLTIRPFDRLSALEAVRSSGHRR